MQSEINLWGSDVSVRLPSKSLVEVKTGIFTPISIDEKAGKGRH